MMDRPLRRLNDPEPLRPANKEPTSKRTPQKQRKDSGRWHDLNQFIDITMRELSPRQVAVWMTLFRDSRKGIAGVSQSFIATRCGLQRPTVSSTIAELERLGLVVTIHTGGVGRGVSKYRVQPLIQTPK